MTPNPFAAFLASLTFVLSSYLDGISRVEPNHTKKRIVEIKIHTAKSQGEDFFNPDPISEKLGIYTVF